MFLCCCLQQLLFPPTIFARCLPIAPGSDFAGFRANCNGGARAGLAGRGELLRPPPAAFRFSTRNPAGRGAIGDCGWRQAAGRSVFNLLQSPGINRLGGEQPTAARCAADASRRIQHKFSGWFPRREAWLQAGGVSFEINHEMHPVLISGAGFPSPGWGVNGIWCSWMGGRGG